MRYFAVERSISTVYRFVASKITLTRWRLNDIAKKKFEAELELWLSENYSIWRRLGNSISYRLRNLRRIKFRWLALPYYLMTLALAASGPAIAYETSGRITFERAALYFLAILSALLLFQFLKAWSDANARRVSRSLQTIWVRIGDLLNTVKSGATAAAQKDNSIEATLAIAVGLAAEIASLPSQEFAASLVQYDSTGHSKMIVTHRNRGSERPVRRQVKDISTLFGHHACQSGGAPRVVPDIRKFGSLGLTSPTQPKAAYRSLFLQPVTSSGSQKLKGFISVDCTQPHAFHGRRADDLVALLEPLKAHIEDMI